MLVPFIVKKRNIRKGAIESNHRLLRYIVPKGTSIDKLTNTIDSKLMSNINNYPIKELGNKTPISLFRIIYGDEILNSFNIHSIESKNINLTPSLLAK